MPTWRGWLLITLIGFGLALTFVKTIHPFLSVSTSSTDTKANADAILVVEGWVPDYALDASIKEFKTGKYKKLYVTGGPMERAASLTEFKTYAELGAAALVERGLPANLVQAVPATEIGKDRTYNSAIMLRTWLRSRQLSPRSYHIISLGAHARRTRLLFEKVVDDNVQVNITAVKDIYFDPAQWWRSSEGVRTVVNETTAYIYVRLFFWPIRK